MKDKDFNRLIRTDIGDVLVHWTRRNGKTETAFDILTRILEEETLKGGTGYIRGKYNCVCFTESPISDLVKVFTLSRLYSEREDRNRYEPYGIAVKKQWLFNLGGRPVIYSSGEEFDTLPESMRWRYVNFNPVQTDFTREREWRIRVDTLTLEPAQTAIIVPTKQHANRLIEMFGTKWLPISLSVLGLPVDGD